MNSERQVVLVFGRTGSGKSDYTKKFVKNFSRVVVIDPKGEYEGLIFYTSEDLIDYYQNNEPEDFTFVCRFKNEIDYDAVFRFCDIVGNLLLVVEEAEIYISPYAKSSEFLNLVRYGRHSGVSIIGIARRASELSIDFKAMVNTMISFKQVLPEDLKIMEKYGLTGLDTLSDTFPNLEYKQVDF